MKNRLLRALCLLLTLVLLLCAVSTAYAEDAGAAAPDPAETETAAEQTADTEETNEQAAAETAAPAPRAVGDTVTLGYYPQGFDPDNKVRLYSPIEWTVLEVRADGSVLLLSKYALDCQPFNEKQETQQAAKPEAAADAAQGDGSEGLEPEPQDIPTSWESCTLRKWLNEDFYDKAFKEAEKEMILTSEVSADANPDCATEQGGATQDKVYLLSRAEVEKYFKNEDERLCVPTAYAVKGQRVYQDKDHTVDDAATCWWWLRTMGEDPEHATIVFLEGIVAVFGENVNLANFGVRPVIAVKLS